MSLSPYFRKADPCILGCWPFRVKWTSVSAAIAPPGFILALSTLAWKLFFLAAQGSAAFLSSNLEEVLYKSPKLMNEWMNE